MDRRAKLHLKWPSLGRSRCVVSQYGEQDVQALELYFNLDLIPLHTPTNSISTQLDKPQPYHPLPTLCFHLFPQREDLIGAAVEGGLVTALVSALKAHKTELVCEAIACCLLGLVEDHDSWAPLIAAGERSSRNLGPTPSQTPVKNNPWIIGS